MAVSISQALDLVSSKKRNLQTQIIPLEVALGRVCAKEIKCTVDLPVFDNSAMDGYAITAEDLGKKVKIVETVLAGDEIHKCVKAGIAIKVMTGSGLPQGTQIVVPFELTENIDETTVQLPKDLNVGANIRLLGEDIAKDEKVLEVGEFIDYAHIGLLASQGITHVQVYKKPKVAVFASGSELKLHYEQLEPNQIYNSNTPSLVALATKLGCECVFVGKAADNISDIVELIKNAKDADLIVTSGGVSVGEADFTKDAFLACGFEEVFSKIDIKPGKPTVYGYIEDTEILNLPGNPLASMIIFEIFGRTVIYKLLGLKDTNIKHIITKMSHDFKHKKGRNSVLPGYFDGESFTIAEKFSPGMVNVLNKCNAFVVLGEEVEGLTKNQEIKILLMDLALTSKIKSDFINHPPVS